MLKKAGIVVAAAAVGLLAVSPLAFAGESHGKGHGPRVTTLAQGRRRRLVLDLRRTPQGLVNALEQQQRHRVPAICNIDVLKVADNINAPSRVRWRCSASPTTEQTTLSGTRACSTRTRRWWSTERRQTSD